MFRQREFMKRCQVVSLLIFCYVCHTYENKNLIFTIDSVTASKGKVQVGKHKMSRAFILINVLTNISDYVCCQTLLKCYF